MGNSQSRSRTPAEWCDYYENRLCCIACGIQINECFKREILKERDDWKQSARWRKCLFTTAAELEHMYFKKNPLLWSYYYRIILVEPQGERLSGICPRLYNKKNINRVPVDPHQARIFGLARKGSGNVDFRVAKVAVNTEPDRPKERIGYPIHAHCWVILDRVIGHEMVQKHLREFTRAVEAYWSQCTGVGRVELRRDSVIVNPPLDVAILIVDQIYGSRPCSLEMLRDTRNLLEAFQWKLPDTYWRTRCESRLVFEMDDLIRENRPVNWKEFCLGLEELLLDKDWFCNSGMRIRLRTLTSLGGIKECFLDLVDQQA
ncbi:hypothetical protein G4B84_004766 [Aspergillus flavus NRRL3357]|nr:uncharacterized protein G4B84_004766 [Aspergillus flavus NRRL3357]QMW29431.1 hypothetical protein G4B84_004766 [Aspergillus flavus NRRL3357]QMW41503.1 hypothetical protein G4B11_004827 [Aspergillus flavus]